ncbi:MAG: ComEC/Rec2 family competence protein [Acidimicrobiales bacterium]|nr:ComEC/Rec2 family competence protein [Acidimicrobiales bacterium]
MSDRAAIYAALLAVLGAWWHHPVPILVGVTTAVAALGFRRPWLLGLSLLFLASNLGSRAVDGLSPVRESRFSGTVTLVSDPVETRFGLRADVRASIEDSEAPEKHLELRASEGAGGTLSNAAAGQRLHVEGRLAPPPPDAPWLVPRHVVGRLSADRIEPLDEGAWPWRAANRVRTLLADGTSSMPETTRSLYLGFVLGDDRGQPPEIVDDFRASGLTHVMVVSGQNVAFLLALAAPALRRMRLGWRWFGTLMVITAFAVLTRFEPSVLRASAMAAIAATATLTGRPATSVRVLALAVTGLVLVDPLLVRSVGFQLSVGASLGIALLGGPMAERMKGPAWWREAIAVTIAAQVGVAPVLIPRFGGIPVVSIASNLLAVPVAGLVTTWGLPAGFLAGLAGEPIASTLHAPTESMIAWVAGVARVSARVPLGQVGPWEAAALVATVGSISALRKFRATSLGPRRALWAVAALVLLLPAWRLRSPPSALAIAGGSRIVTVDGATVLLLGPNTWPDDLLESLRVAGIRRIDVIATSAPPDRDVIRALRHRWPVGRVLVTGTSGRIVVEGHVLPVGADSQGSARSPLGGHLGGDPPVGRGVSVAPQPP